MLVFLVLFLFLWLLHYPNPSSLILPPLSLFFNLSPDVVSGAHHAAFSL